MAIVTAKAKKQFIFLNSLFQNKSRFEIIVIDERFLDVVAIQGDFINLSMNARYYSTLSCIKGILQMCKKINTFISECRIQPWLSLIEKLIFSAIVCDKVI